MQRAYDGYAVLVIAGIRTLEREGWDAEITDDGLRLTNGKLRHELTTVDSLGSLLSKDEVEDAVWRLRRARNARKLS